MPTLTVKEIRDSETPLHMFLEADDRQRREICDALDNHKFKSSYVARMLVNANDDELSALNIAIVTLTAIKAPEKHDFLPCLSRGINVCETVLGLSSVDSPDQHLLEMNQDRLIEFAPLLNRLTLAECVTIASKINQNASPASRAEITKRLSRTQSRLSPSECALLLALKPVRTKGRLSELKDSLINAFTPDIKQPAYTPLRNASETDNEQQIKSPPQTP